MIVEYTTIDNIDDIDLSSLYDASAIAIERDYQFWPIGMENSEVKKNYYLDLIRDTATINQFNIKPKQYKLVMFKATLDGVDSLLNIGYVNEDNCYTSLWYLTKPDANGSRNWLYSQDEAEHAFYRSQGFTTYLISTTPGSLLYNNIRMRANAGRFTIASERLVESSLNWVEFIINVRTAPI